MQKKAKRWDKTIKILKKKIPFYLKKPIIKIKQLKSWNTNSYFYFRVKYWDKKSKSFKKKNTFKKTSYIEIKTIHLEINNSDFSQKKVKYWDKKINLEIKIPFFIKKKKSNIEIKLKFWDKKSKCIHKISKIWRQKVKIINHE